MRKRRTSAFKITDFSQYRNVEGQYTDQFIKKRRAVLVENKEDEVIAAVSESYKDDNGMLEKVHSPKKLSFLVVRDSDFAEFIGSYVDAARENAPDVNAEKADYSLEEINSDAPVVNIINAICLEAIRKNASDIHIQGTNDFLHVRLRIDGVLQTVRKLDKKIAENLVSRIKVMSGLNVMENRLCQDGRMSVQAEDKKLDFRVSIIPSVTGQNIVLRLFNAEKEDLNLEELGFTEKNYIKIKSALKVPHGIILVTGPTGSGKTTTLHAMIKEMDREHLKIVTIEDPVEKIIEGVEQIQVNDEIGLTFESVLRRILRHDPDVIMVGEIRDKETAELAVRSALTGHLILSTLHTNDSVSAVTRLRNLGVAPYLIAGTLRASIAQRLVRKICKECEGKGCELCSNTGYFGRTAVSEVFMTDSAVEEMIEKELSDGEIRRYLARKGSGSLMYDAALKVKEGITTKDEVIREGLL
ncbi:MAG: GspE/PulE family protein [Treponema sp.]|uniref:GspE/PulE family protein n=1 Tax=Treponema sp. TaxID=166 RepID=UPI00298DA0B1|nr:GspE/PulE family protein [Treponema sp.]MCQ2601212.1 GspE/PulE family protein [Treponema sp.]